VLLFGFGWCFAIWLLAFCILFRALIIPGNEKITRIKATVKNLTLCCDKILELMIKIEKVDRTDVALCTQYMVEVQKMVESADGYADVGKALKNKCNQLLASL
jgi:hypothetical protein